MGWILTATWFVVLAVVPAVGVLLARPRAVERAVDELVRSTGLVTTPRVRAVVAARVRLQRRWSSTGGAAALVPLSLVVGASFGWTWSLPMVFALVAATIVAAAVGSTLAALRAERVASQQGARDVQAPGARLADHVPLLERAAARVLPVIALAVVALAAATGGGAVPTVVAAALVVAAVLLRELGSRALLAAPRAAGSTDELAWQDAFRAHDLLGLSYAVTGAGAWAAFLSAWAGAAPAVTMTAIAVGVVAIGAVWLAQLRAERGTADRHVLDRLWPEVARDLEPVVP